MEDALQSIFSNVIYLIQQNETGKALEGVKGFVKALQTQGLSAKEKVQMTSTLFKSISQHGLSVMQSVYPQKSLTIFKQLMEAINCIPEGVLISDITDIYNNLACAYRGLNKTNIALKILENTLDILDKNPQAKADRATTLLNLCAIYSHMGQHTTALNFARSAVINAHQQLEDKSITNKFNGTTVLSMCCYNLAVEFEHIGEFQQALKYYQRALSVVEGMDGNEALKGEFRQGIEGILKKGRQVKLQKTMIENKVDKVCRVQSRSLSRTRTRSSFQKRERLSRSGSRTQKLVQSARSLKNSPLVQKRVQQNSHLQSTYKALKFDYQKQKLPFVSRPNIVKKHFQKENRALDIVDINSHGYSQPISFNNAPLNIRDLDNNSQLQTQALIRG